MRAETAENKTVIRFQPPHAGQLKVLREAKRFNVLQCGRRYGKTTLGLRVAIKAAVLNRQPVGWFAPTYKFLADVWREAIRTIGAAASAINVQEKRIELASGGSLEFWSVDQPDAGRSRKYKLVVIDEAGIVRNLESVWQEAIRPTLADLKGDAWLLGTPKGNGYFNRLYMRGQSGDAGWASWRMPTLANPTIDPAEIEDARRDMPPNAFEQEYMGVPADDGGNPFGLAAIGACSDGVLISSAKPVAFGVDLAKSLDFSVVCGLDSQGVVCVLERWQSDWEQTTRRVIDATGNTPTLIDSTGVGDPIVERLTRANLAAQGFKFTSQSKQQLMEGLAASIQRREVRFPAGWLTAELEAFEFQYAKGSVKYCLAPSTRVLTHDLRWVEVASVCAGQSLLAFEEHPFERGRNRRWRRSTVTDVGVVVRPCYRISLDDGTELIASAEHLWLVDTGPGGLQWRTTEQLRAVHPTSNSLRYAPSRLVRAVDVWPGASDSYDAGYLAGVLDGEGNLSQCRRGNRDGQYAFRISFAQRENGLADYARRCMKRFGFQWSETTGSGTNKNVTGFHFSGGLPEMLRLLGQVRPKRLLAALDGDKLGSIYKLSTPKVSSKIPLGEMPVVALGTTTKTLVAEGILSHNSAPSGMHDDGVIALALAERMRSDHLHNRVQFDSGFFCLTASA